MPPTKPVKPILLKPKTAASLLKEAAARAKSARIEVDSQAKPHRFAINYRLDKIAQSAEGDDAKR